MATKRLKFLKRVKILQQDVRVRLEANGRVKRFKVSLNLADYGFPADAQVVIEAKQLLETIRFGLGPVAAPSTSTFYDISRLKGERVTFNVLVLDRLTARKLGFATTIRPNANEDEAPESIPLLPVDASARVAPLLWEIDYSDTDQDGYSDAPVLKVDAEASNHSAAFFMQDASVRAMVLPAAMKEILNRVLLIDEGEYDVTSRSWRNSWVRFASRLAGEELPELETANWKDERVAWIDKATKALAQNADLLPTYMRERAIR